MSFKENLKEFRRQHGYSAVQMASILNIPYSTYVAYENQKREPRYSMLIKIADLLNVSLDDLLGRRNNILGKNKEHLLKIRNLIMLEVNKQQNQWGKENLAPHEWLGLIMEEVGEMSEAVNETYLPNATKPKLGGIKNIKNEALQSAALIIRFLESLEEK